MSNATELVFCNCSKRFRTSEALARHLQMYPNHPQLPSPQSIRDQHLVNYTRRAVPIVGTDKVKCACRKEVKAFGLQAHIENSTRHIRLRTLERGAAEKALRNSTQPGSSRTTPAQNTHSQQHPAPPQPPSTTPLDRFFKSFKLFKYDRSLPPATSWKRLQQQRGWWQGNKEGDRAWQRYQTALEEEVKVLFGKVDDIVAWHTLCKAVGIVPAPGTVNECKAIIRKSHVNIVDLIEWGRRGGENGAVKRFRTVGLLAEYSLRHGKIFPKGDVHNKGERNVVLRYLLRHILQGHMVS